MLHAQFSIDGAGPESALITRDLGQLEREAPGCVIAPGSRLFTAQHLGAGIESLVSGNPGT
eukprot:5026705-Alexandrium_andersonii.AAC.1